MKITIKIETKVDTYSKNVELSYDEPTNSSDYPRILTNDKYVNDITKSKRLIEAISELVDQAIKASSKE